MWIHSLLLLLVALVGIGQLVTVTVDAQDVASLSSEELAELQKELNEWKQSAVGQEAIKLGFAQPQVAADLPSSQVSDRPSFDLDQLQRLRNAKTTIEELKTKQPHAQFSLATPFALMTQQEFASYVNQSNVAEHRRLMQQSRLRGTLADVGREGIGGIRGLEAMANNNSSGAAPNSNTVPEEVDWQAQGCVTRVKDQGSCGVCWAFAAIGAVESGYCISSGTLLELSEQDIVSCGPSAGTCNGGWAYAAYDWMITQNGGSVCSEASLPYDSRFGFTPGCTRYDDPNDPCVKPDIGLVAYVTAEYEDHTKLEQVVAQRPVATQLKSGVPLFQFYSGGILMGDEEACPSYSDHELTIVGYGVRDGIEYWKVKNQWGTFWGEDGYGYLQRGYQGAPYGTCGIESWSYYPIFRSQAPWAEDRRCGQQRGNTQLVGTILKTTTPRNSNQCCDNCKAEEGCVATTWSYGTFPAVCQLLSSVDHEVRDSMWASVYVVPKSDERCMPVENNVDYVGMDLRRTMTESPGECCDICTQLTDCRAYTWSKYMGGSCFLKYFKSEAQVHDPLPDGSPYFVSGEVYRCQPLRENVDIVGQDLSNTPASYAAACCPICISTPGCKAFSWSEYNGGTCWLKTSTNETISNPGVTTGDLYYY